MAADYQQIEQLTSQRTTSRSLPREFKIKLREMKERLREARMHVERI